ncbi:hypothetical protein I553_1826 [Mycobacterium xenopi 4042]|uniref:Uncharacterized protein n=1 Tax=Mycobacterium xenopi 4042 TaxID=1299334 RepID=X8DLP7_MYCXE|nr:hypothetical protein I553_1826 [Mycobacterium xenopi 4042]
MSVRGLHESVRPSPIFLAIVALTACGGVLAWLAGPTLGRWPMSGCSSS